MTAHVQAGYTEIKPTSGRRLRLPFVRCSCGRRVHGLGPRTAGRRWRLHRAVGR